VGFRISWDKAILKRKMGFISKSFKVHLKESNVVRMPDFPDRLSHFFPINQSFWL